MIHFNVSTFNHLICNTLCDSNLKKIMFTKNILKNPDLRITIMNKPKAYEILTIDFL